MTCIYFIWMWLRNKRPQSIYNCPCLRKSLFTIRSAPALDILRRSMLASVRSCSTVFRRFATCSRNKRTVFTLAYYYYSVSQRDPYVSKEVSIWQFLVQTKYWVSQKEADRDGWCFPQQTNDTQKFSKA